MSGPMQQFVDIVSKDRSTQELNNNVSRVFASIISNPLLSTITIVQTIVLIANTPQLVNHKLGKLITGFIVINSNAVSSIFQPGTTNPSPTASIYLQSNADVTISVLFF